MEGRKEGEGIRQPWGTSNESAAYFSIAVYPLRGGCKIWRRLGTGGGLVSIVTNPVLAVSTNSKRDCPHLSRIRYENASLPTSTLGRAEL